MNEGPDELDRTQWEFNKREETHSRILRLSMAQRTQLKSTLFGGRWFGSLTVDELHALAEQIEAFQNAAEVKAFLDAPQDRAPAFTQPFAWSANAAHIQTLFQPWQPLDGYPEAVISAGEAALGHPLPEPLRSFYRYWARREKLITFHNLLLGPHGIFVKSGVVVFGVENQGVNYWGVRWADLDQENPPVYWAYNEEVDGELIWEPSQPHLSDFLDTLTYFHAFCGGANHGGLWNGVLNKSVLEQHWRLIEIPTVVMGFAFHGAPEPGWPIYIRDGQAIDNDFIGGVVAGTTEDLDEFSRVMGVPWRNRW